MCCGFSSEKALLKSPAHITFRVVGMSPYRIVIVGLESVDDTVSKPALASKRLSVAKLLALLGVLL